MENTTTNASNRSDLSPGVSPSVDSETPILIAYDATLKRPGCVNLQAILAHGRPPHFLDAFPVATWLLEITPGLKTYRCTKEEYRNLIQLTVDHYQRTSGYKLPAKRYR